ncbi:MAG TPA: dihydropteroate synthase [Solirubrobacterales bacterium]|jgi:dihydropteroate synthase|nr:dihydropteroate synthase [Solirubrobacterales bacterium]
MSLWRLRDRTLQFPPPLGAGIVNVTDDSFFSGARSGTPGRAVADGLALVEAGFDLLDVGAVPARSGPPVPASEETGRLVPAVERLAAESGVPVLADTFSAAVAAAALDAGAAGINDIGGGADEGMLDLVADRGCGYVLMHIEGPPRSDRRQCDYPDPVGHLKAWFSERLETAAARGVAEEQIALDPGLDFDLSVDDDLEVLRRLAELRELARPLFVALSRKDFLGAMVAGSWERRVPAEEREAATLAATAVAVAEGAEVLRLHDPSALDSLRTAAAISGAGARDG